MGQHPLSSPGRSEPAFPIALSIAGSDPTGGAGLQLDLQVFARHGVHGMAVPTALTVQTTEGVDQTLPVFPGAVGRQIERLLQDVQPHAIKIGMLGTDDALLRVAGALQGCDVPRVVDPVLRASDGSYLLERRAWPNLCNLIVPGAALVTPNLAEAELLSGERAPERAASVLLELGAKAVLIKAGHADGPPDDLLVTPTVTRVLPGTRMPRDPHGTGCALSSSIAARLALGQPLEVAVEGAKDWVARAIEAAFCAGRGRPLLRLPAS